MSEQITPKDIKFFQVKANGRDITAMILQCDIFQDLFMPTWSCTLMLSDTQNLLMNVPIVAGTEVQVIAETDYPTPEKKTFKFVVYKISDRIQIKQEHQGYQLNCVTREFYTNQKRRVSKSYRNHKPTDIATDLLQLSKLGKLSTFDTDDKRYSMIIPNMSPFAAIGQLIKFTKNPRGGADFMFYQSDDQEFKFRSLDKMMVDRSGVTFKQLNPNRMTENSNIPLENFLNIEHYEFLTQHDSMNNFAAGYYANKVISHDIYSKSFSTTVFNYGDDIPADKEMKPFSGPWFDNADDAHVVYHPVSTNSLGANVQQPSDTYREWLGSRKTNVMKLEENRLVISVPGAVSHYKLLGRQVDIELPSHQDLDDQQYLDRYMKGSYVVAAIRHTFMTDAYTCTMELGKKRVETPYEL